MVVSTHAMMSAGTLTTLPTNAGSVVVRHDSIHSTIIIPPIITGSVKIPTDKIPIVKIPTVKIPIVKTPTVKTPTVVPDTIKQQKVSKVTTNELEKPIRKEISPEALRALNKRRQAALYIEMESRILQPKPPDTINPNHDGDHWLRLK